MILDVVTPVALRMMLPLGQTGVACYRHTPRRPAVAPEPSEPAVVPLVPVREARSDDGAPATAARLAAARGGVVLYAAALFPDGPTSAPGVTPEGEKARVPLPALDRWVLREALVVKWPRGFACWSRSGRGRWSPGVAWWREGPGWRYGRHSALPSEP